MYYAIRSAALEEDSHKLQNTSQERHMQSSADTPIYSRRLREARQAKGLSQRALGVQAGISESSASARINRYETGVHQPDYQTLAALAKALLLPTAYFYAEDDDLAALIALYESNQPQR